MKDILQQLPGRAWFLAVALFLALAPGVSAHALLYYSLPKVGGVLTNAPDKILICFTEYLKAEGSTIQVRDAKGDVVDKKDSQRDRRDWAKLSVSLPKLPPGIYKVSWHALSVDNHKTEGHFEFTVK